VSQSIEHVGHLASEHDEHHRIGGIQEK
jgi:hypothetical protein